MTLRLMKTGSEQHFTASKDSTSHLRSNDDIQWFGRFIKALPFSSNEGDAKGLISFREAMRFPKGTTVYKIKGPRVAVLPDYSLIMDDGGLGGRAFESASEYRARTGDRDDWDAIKTF
jgi:hypothetical protein